MIVDAVGLSCTFMQSHRLAVLNVELWLHIVFQTVSQGEQIRTIKGAKLPGNLGILGDDRSFQSLLGDRS